MTARSGTGDGGPGGVFRADPGSVRRWEAPEVAAPERAAAPSPLMTAEQLETLQREAREEAFRQGREEGRRSGEREVKTAVRRLDALVAALNPAVQVVDDALYEQMADVVVSVTRHFVRRALTHSRGEVVRVVREALAVLPAASGMIDLRLHPEDAVLVRDALHLDELERDWRIREDPTVARGGAHLRTDTSYVDASVEARMNTLIARLLGGERREDTTRPSGDIEPDASALERPAPEPPAPPASEAPASEPPATEGCASEPPASQEPAAEIPTPVSEAAPGGLHDRD